MAATARAGATVCSRFDQTARRHADRGALRTLDGRECSWLDYRERVRAAAAGLAGLGLERGDVMACWLTNRPEFHVADAAAMHVGAATVSIYNTFAFEQAGHVVADCGARILITESAYVEPAIALRSRGGTALEHIVCVEGDAPEALGWDELLDAASPRFDFESTWRSVEPSDLATVIYTSGTTGPPKGVELTHDNVTAQTRALTERLRLPEAIRAVSFLPMAHIAERLCAHYLPMFLGWEVSCCPDAGMVDAAIADVRPGYFFSPPAIWQKLRTRIIAAAEEPALAALEAAITRVRTEGAPQDGAVQATARASVGFDELVAAVVGAAACPRDLIEFWHACGVPLSELYGMSETTGAATVAGPGAVRIGTAGPPLPACEVRVSDEGEICLRGPAVTRGYRNLPQHTADARDESGWLHSGDRGYFDEHGYLCVVDNPIVSSTGQSMSPARIEAALTAGGSLIGQACVIGDARPFNVALLTLDPDGLRRYIETHGISLARPTHHREVIEAVADEVSRANARLSRVERVRRFALLADDWLPGGDALTPTMKLRRSVIADRYAETIDALYDSSAGFVVGRLTGRA